MLKNIENKIFTNPYIATFADVLILALIFATVFVWPAPMLISALSTPSVILGFVSIVASIIALLGYVKYIIKREI